MIERYTRKKMGEIWSRRARYSKWLDVEISVVKAYRDLGIISEKECSEIEKKAVFEIERIDELDKVTNHEVIAFIQNIEEHIGNLSRYFHLGLTSSDIMDTGLILQLRDALYEILNSASEVLTTLKSLALRYKNTPTIGRTHGIHAEPTSFGLKMALLYKSFKDDIECLERARDGILYGKISGAVGNYSHISPKIEEIACKYLDLKPAPISSQVLAREPFAELISSITIMGATLEKIALEIRHLQRTEIGEVFEPFAKGQKGSSAMPHKRNPVLCERICGLSRLLRSFVAPSIENILLWHERDISHSSVERVILPDSTILIDYMLDRTLYILENIEVSEETMRRNIEITGRTVFSGGLLYKLTMNGLSRTEAYNVIQDASFKAYNNKTDFKDEVLSDKKIMSFLSKKEVEEIFIIDWYLRWVDDIYKRLGLL
ncbi:MAG: adenylosuccinate lyase [bacterium]